MKKEETGLLVDDKKTNPLPFEDWSGFPNTLYLGSNIWFSQFYIHLEDKYITLERFNNRSIEEIREDWYSFTHFSYLDFISNSRKTLTEFAEWVGISQPLMSRQTKRGGTIPTDQKSISAWVNRYGNVVYIILGLPIPKNPVDDIPEPMRSAMKEYISILAMKNLKPNSPEAKKEFDLILEKNGIKYAIEVKSK